MFRSIADGSGTFCGALTALELPQAWGEPKYQEEGVKVCGALLAVCYNPDTQVQIHYNIHPRHEMPTRPIERRRRQKQQECMQ